MKTLMVLVLIAVLGALASAGFFMLKREPDAAGEPASRDRRMARALAVRVGLCVALFILILFAWSMGWVQPGGLPVGV